MSSSTCWGTFRCRPGSSGGARTASCRLPFAERLHALIPHSELHWIEGAGHTVQEDAPAQLLALLTRGFRPADAGAGA